MREPLVVLLFRKGFTEFFNQRLAFPPPCGLKWHVRWASTQSVPYEEAGPVGPGSKRGPRGGGSACLVGLPWLRVLAGSRCQAH